MASATLRRFCRDNFYCISRVNPQISSRVCFHKNLHLGSLFGAEKKEDLSPVDDAVSNSQVVDEICEAPSFTESTAKGDCVIPEPGNLDLYEYIKVLEKTTARGQGVILKTWSRITKDPKTLNISSAFESRSVQFLGLTSHLLQKRLKFLAEIGIKGRDALILAAEFPAILSWEFPNFRSMLQLLNDLKCDIVRLLCRNPYVFGLDHTKATENLHKLTACGVSSETVGKLVTNHPMMLSFPFSDDCLEVVQLLTNAHAKLQIYLSGHQESSAMEEAILNLLLQPLEKPQERVSLQDSFKQVVSFLLEMQVSPLEIAAKNPMIFVTPIETLHSALDLFSSKPLLFEMDVIQELLTSRPEIFVDFDAVFMRARIQLIYDIVQSPTVLYNLLQSSFPFEKSDTKIEEIIQWLRSHGIEDKIIGYLMTLKNFFSLEKRELIEKTNYLLTVKGVKMEDIRESPACLLKPLSHLKERIEFLRAENPAVLENKNLSQVLLSKNKEFAVEVCASSLETFSQFLGIQKND